MLVPKGATGHKSCLTYTCFVFRLVRLRVLMGKSQEGGRSFSYRRELGIREERRGYKSQRGGRQIIHR